MSIADINARVLAGIKRAGARTGNGALFGTLSRYTAPVDSVYPPTKGTATEYPCTLLWDMFGAMARASDAVEAEDVKAIIPAAGITVVPQIGDKLTVAGETYSIVMVDTIRPGGVGILYTCQCRK